MSAGGEAVNAQVCKTCIRGFNSRPALQTNLTESRGIMPNTETAVARRTLSPDLFAVALALLAVLLVRFNLIPPVKW